MRPSLQGIAIAGLLVSALSLSAGDRLFHGEIADSSCAMNVHSLTRSHREMLNGKTMGTDAKSCTNYCVHKMGAVYMLKTPEAVYHLDPQDLVVPFAGGKVVINGNLDPQTHTLHITSIKAE